MDLICKGESRRATHSLPVYFLFCSPIDFSRHLCMLFPLIISAKGQSRKERILWLRVCKCLHLLVCSERGWKLVGGGANQEQKHFADVAVRKGVNGKCCGYRSDHVIGLRLMILKHK